MAAFAAPKPAGGGVAQRWLAANAARAPKNHDERVKEISKYIERTIDAKAAFPAGVETWLETNAWSTNGALSSEAMKLLGLPP